MDEAPGGGCPIWPRKRLYLSADRASIELRKRWREYGEPRMLTAYPCAYTSPTMPQHWHLGNLATAGVR